MALVAVNKNIMKFNDYNWHDSVIKNIIIDRNTPGVNDIIQLDIVWSDDKIYTISFIDVYWANFDMNFGIVCSESILSASSEGRNNKILNKFYLKWRGLIDDINLSLFEIKLNSTGSNIKIIAKKFEIQPPPQLSEV